MDQQSHKRRTTLASFIFLSRWLQAPLYVGLIVAQAVYVYRFLVELWHLVGYAVLGHPAPQSVVLGLANQKIPERLEVVDALPRNTLGKVLKRDLRATFAPPG